MPPTNRDDRDRRTVSYQEMSSPPTGDWLFAQCILGNPVRVFRLPPRELTDSEQFIKSISDRRFPRQTEPTYVVVSEARLFARDVLGKPLAKSLRGATDITPAKYLSEAGWNPADHPRGGFPQNRGWFSTTAGAGGGAPSTPSEKDSPWPDRGLPGKDKPTPPYSDLVLRPGDGKRATTLPFIFGNQPKASLLGYDEQPEQPSPPSDNPADAKKGYTQKDWIKRVDGVETKKAGGTVKLDDGSEARVRVFNGATVKVRKSNGNVEEEANLVQFEATGPDCDELHWIQFYNERQYDKQGKEIDGGAAQEGHLTFFGEWYLDATPPKEGQRPTPNTIYYDNPDGNNTYARDKTSLSSFDKSKGSDLEPYRPAKGLSISRPI